MPQYLVGKSRGSLLAKSEVELQPVFVTVRTKGRDLSAFLLMKSTGDMHRVEQEYEPAKLIILCSKRENSTNACSNQTAAAFLYL